MMMIFPLYISAQAPTGLIARSYDRDASNESNESPYIMTIAPDGACSQIQNKSPYLAHLRDPLMDTTNNKSPVFLLLISAVRLLTWLIYQTANWATVYIEFFQWPIPPSVTRIAYRDLDWDTEAWNSFNIVLPETAGYYAKTTAAVIKGVIFFIVGLIIFVLILRCRKQSAPYPSYNPGHHPMCGHLYLPPIGVPYGYGVGGPRTLVNSGVGNVTNTFLSNVGNVNSVKRASRAPRTRRRRPFR